MISFMADVEARKYASNIFAVPKPNGKIWLILDLSSLNDDLIKQHFKMEHLDTAIAMISKDCFMASIDLLDAYYSVSIHRDHRKNFGHSRAGYRFIRTVASAIGLMKNSHVKFLESDKILSLHKAGTRQFKGPFRLSQKGQEDLLWWLHNVGTRSREIRIKAPSIFITTDASTLGWGVVWQDQWSGGRWGKLEWDFHINVLEIKAIELGLKTFFKNSRGVYIKVVSDNTTAVTYVNHMGGH